MIVAVLNHILVHGERAESVAEICRASVAIIVVIFKIVVFFILLVAPFFHD